MAKTAKLKKNSKSSSLHSRAAKRATSPSINLDKSLKPISPSPSAPSSHPSILRPNPSNGIQKSNSRGKGKGRGKVLSRQQRLKQERGMERAATVMERTERKMERSVGRERAGRERSAAWDELNGKVLGRKGRGKVVGKGTEKANEEEDGWEDEEMDVEESRGGDEGSGDGGTGGVAAMVVEASAAPETAVGRPDEDDEIL